jgi:hypothetical protein
MVLNAQVEWGVGEMLPDHGSLKNVQGTVSLGEGARTPKGGALREAPTGGGAVAHGGGALAVVAPNIEGDTGGGTALGGDTTD